MPVKVGTTGGDKYATILSEKERHKMEHKQHHYNSILENTVCKEQTGKKHIKILPVCTWMVRLWVSFFLLFPILRLTLNDPSSHRILELLKQQEDLFNQLEISDTKMNKQVCILEG